MRSRSATRLNDEPDGLIWNKPLPAVCVEKCDVVCGGDRDASLQLEILTLHDHGLTRVLQLTESSLEGLRTPVSDRASLPGSLGHREHDLGEMGVDGPHAGIEDCEVGVDCDQHPAVSSLAASQDDRVASAHDLVGNIGQRTSPATLLVGELFDIFRFPAKLAANRLAKFRGQFLELALFKPFLRHRLPTVT